jgi:hypothetical protein
MAYFNDLNSVLYGNASDSYEPETSSDATSSDEDADESSSSNKSSSNKSSSNKSSSGKSSSDSDEVKKPTDIPDDAYLIHNEKEALALCKRLEKLDNVLSVEYISSEKGLESIKEGLLDGKDQYFTFLDGEYGNPLSGAAKITLKDMGKFKETLKAIQNVKGAISAGATAFVGGIVTTLVCMCFIPVISRIGGKPEPLPPVDQK